MEAGAAFAADAQASEPVEPGDGALDDPAGAAEAGTVRGPTVGDDRPDVTLPQRAAVSGAVVAPVGVRPRGAASGPAAQAADGWYRIEQGRELGDIVPVAAGQGDGRRGAVPVDGRWSDMILL